VKVTSLPDADARPRRVAVGTFDGVHLGHREVINGSDTVLTFDPHPLSVVAPQAVPKLLDSPAIKRDLIAGLGVDELVTIPFDRDFASKSAEQFVEEVLIERLGASAVSVGENFRFGKGAKGDPELLRSRSEFETRVVPLVEVEGETVSSTHIRGLVAAGDVERASRFLGAPFMLDGVVVILHPLRSAENQLKLARVLPPRREEPIPRHVLRPVLFPPDRSRPVHPLPQDGRGMQHEQVDIAMHGQRLEDAEVAGGQTGQPEEREARRKVDGVPLLTEARARLLHPLDGRGNLDGVPEPPPQLRLPVIGAPLGPLLEELRPIQRVPIEEPGDMPERAEPPRPPILPPQIAREPLQPGLLDRRVDDLEQSPDGMLGKPGIRLAVDPRRGRDGIPEQPARRGKVDVRADPEPHRERLSQPPLHTAGGDRDDLESEGILGSVREHPSEGLYEPVGPFRAMDVQHDPDPYTTAPTSTGASRVAVRVSSHGLCARSRPIRTFVESSELGGACAGSLDGR